MKSALVIATLAATSYAAKARDDASTADAPADASLDATPAIVDIDDTAAPVEEARDAAVEADQADIPQAFPEPMIEEPVVPQKTMDDVEDDITATPDAPSTADLDDEPTISGKGNFSGPEPMIEDPVPMIEDPVLPPTFADIENGKVAQPDVMVWSEEEI
jgi:hypothetical protein